MVQVLVAASPKGRKFFYNIDAKVGARAPNPAMDVHLVQFGYFCMLRSPQNLGSLSPAEMAAFADVKLGSPCTGQESDPLVRAIRAHEASRGGTQDGIVSELRQGHITYTEGKIERGLILVALNNSIRQIMGDQYPRIDLHKSCPGDLKAFVSGLFG